MTPFDVILEAALQLPMRRTAGILRCQVDWKIPDCAGMTMGALARYQCLQLAVVEAFFYLEVGDAIDFVDGNFVHAFDAGGSLDE